MVMNVFETTAGHVPTLSATIRLTVTTKGHTTPTVGLLGTVAAALPGARTGTLLMVSVPEATVPTRGRRLRVAKITITGIASDAMADGARETLPTAELSEDLRRRHC